MLAAATVDWSVDLMDVKLAESTVDWMAENLVENLGASRVVPLAELTVGLSVATSDDWTVELKAARRVHQSAVNSAAWTVEKMAEM